MSHPRIGIVLSNFNAEISERLWENCKSALIEQGLSHADWTLLRVPGALEIPLALQHLAQKNRYHGLIGLGVVIRGETYHFEVVSNQSAAGLMQVQLSTSTPIANGILTTENEAQAIERANQKGRECVQTVLAMLEELSEK
jgi:6,7-dimethyl-8-ribityllumazine synthase